MPYPIRIGMIVGKMVGGGVESVIMNYYRHINRLHVQFDFIVDSDSTFVPNEEIKDLGGRVFEVPPYQNLPMYEKKLRSLFVKEGWQIVHSHINALSVFPLHVAKSVGVPVRIAHSHSTAGKGEYVKNAAKRVLRTQANRYPTHRLACSQYAGEWLFGKNADFDILYNAVDLDKFIFDESIRKQVRAELGLTDTQYVVGHVGRFMTQKNHKFLIDFFERLTKARDDSVLLLVGDGELRPFVERLVVERRLEGKVRFLGQRSDAWRFYQAFDAFVLPSLYEGLCLVGIEAQRSGLSCLFSDEITREVDITNTCVFLPIDDSMVWSEALLGVANKLGRNRNLLGLDDCFASYNIKQAAPKLVDYYERLALESADTNVGR